MERFAKRRFAALLLALLLAAASVLPAGAAAAPPAGSVPFTEVTPPEDVAAPPPFHQLLGAEPQTVSDEPLRAIIELEKPSLLEEGYEADDLFDNAAAQEYNAQLEQDQADVIAAIEKATGERLEVVWRLTVIANLLSVWVRPAQMEIIAAVPGVRSVQAEAIAVPMEDGEAEEPGEAEESEPSGEEALGENAGGQAAAGEPAAEDLGTEAIAAGETGGPIEEVSGPEWETDYTGAGQRIAIIDTGTDEWHRSLNSGAWMYALSKNAAFNDKDLDDYLLSLPLLDEDGVQEVLGSLAITKRHLELLEGEAWKKLAEHGDAETLSGHSLRKIAFGANYSSYGSCDDIAHYDRSEHGSHVAGIAAANRYLPTEECWDSEKGTLRPDVDPNDEKTYVERSEVTVKLEDDEEDEGDEESEPKTRDAVVQGQAPDAQLLVMQVFSEDGSAESDYMAAIQDALLLGADTINLSLGSNEAGASFALTLAFQRVVNGLVNSGAIVVAAQGNSSHWTRPNLPGNKDGLPALPYADDVVFDSGGSPASYDTFLAVAAADDMTSGGTRMAWFSSWGVPSTLELKPEITAPGNKIASLNGAHESMYESSPEDALHGNYEEMSGTSMAAPQIAGMAALVMEHLKKLRPAWKGPQLRQVAQSLLMSTAVPMVDPDDLDENYYSVMQQGAGLADVKKAVTANAYITMDENATYRSRSAGDGKVKAELGENESGQFRFSFTVHNLDDSPHQYRVRTDLFTQALTTQDDGSPALDTKTTPLLGVGGCMVQRRCR